MTKRQMRLGLPMRYLGGLVQSGQFMGYTESGQSRANQGTPRFACNPDLNHAVYGYNGIGRTASRLCSIVIRSRRALRRICRA